LFVVELLWFIAVPVSRELKVWRERWPGIRARAPSRRRLRLSLTVGGLLLVLLVAPLPGRVSVSAMLRPAQTWTFYAPGHAQLASATVAEGDRVVAGSELWQLKAPEVELRRTLAAARLTSLSWAAAASGLSEDGRERWLVSHEEKQSAEAEHAAALEDAARYWLAAPFDGVLRDVNPDLLPGQWVPARTPLGLMVAPGPMLVETYLEEAHLKRLKPGNTGMFSPDGASGPLWSVTLLQVDADASRTLAHGMLDAAAGGHVLTRRQGDTRVPEQGIFRALLAVEGEPGVLDGRIWRGQVVLQAQPESIAGRYLQQSLSVLLREAGL
jgi:putative peptide zinc metalloprotease protein